MITLLRKTIQSTWITYGGGQIEVEVGIHPLAEAMPFYGTDPYSADDGIVPRHAESYFQYLFLPRAYYALWAPAVSDDCYIHPWLLDNRHRLISPRLFSYIEWSVRARSDLRPPGHYLGMLDLWDRVIKNQDIQLAGSETRIPAVFQGPADGQVEYLAARIEELKRVTETVTMPEYPTDAEFREFLLVTRKEAGGRYACLG
jgi:hypothetical protein